MGFEGFRPRVSSSAEGSSVDPAQIESILKSLHKKQNTIDPQIEEGLELPEDKAQELRGVIQSIRSIKE